MIKMKKDREKLYRGKLSYDDCTVVFFGLIPERRDTNRLDESTPLDSAKIQIEIIFCNVSEALHHFSLDIA